MSWHVFLWQLTFIASNIGDQEKLGKVFLPNGDKNRKCKLESGSSPSQLLSKSKKFTLSIPLYGYF